MDTRSQSLIVLERLQTAQMRLAMGALVVIVGITVADVLLRYLFGKPIYGAYDIVESCMIVFVFNGIAVVFLNRRNIVIDLIDAVLGHRLTIVLIALTDVLSILLLVLVGCAMVAPAVQAFQYGDRKLELGLPIYVLWIVALIGLFGTIACSLGALLANARGRHST